MQKQENLLTSDSKRPVRYARLECIRCKGGREGRRYGDKSEAGHKAKLHKQQLIPAIDLRREAQQLNAFLEADFLAQVAFWPSPPIEIPVLGLPHQPRLLVLRYHLRVSSVPHVNLNHECRDKEPRIPKNMHASIRGTSKAILPFCGQAWKCSH